MKKKILNIRKPDIPEVEEEGDIEELQKEAMRAIAVGLDEALNGDARGADREVGFVLLVFPFGEHDVTCNYVSNGANRVEINELLLNALKRAKELEELEKANENGSRN